MKWLTWDVSGINPIVYYWYEPRSKWNILQHKGNIDRDHQHNHVIDVIVIEICLHYALHCIYYQTVILSTVLWVDKDNKDQIIIYSRPLENYQLTFHSIRLFVKEDAVFILLYLDHVQVTLLKKIRSTNDKKKARNEFVYCVKRNKGISAFGEYDDIGSPEWIVKAEGRLYVEMYCWARQYNR